MHTRRRSFIRLLQLPAALCLVALTACSTTGEINEAGLYRERGGPAEAGPEPDLAPADAGVDAAQDAAADAAQDAAADAAVDAAGDVAADAVLDAAADAAPDAAVDAAGDVAADAALDAATELGDLGPVGDVFPAPPDAVGDVRVIGDGPLYGCGPATAAGCCRGSVLYYCDGSGVLFAVDCAAKPKCGWDATYAQYDCGTAGKADPSGALPMSCPF